MNFASTWNNLLKHCISAEFRLMEGHVQGTLRKELYIAPLVKCFKTATLGKSSQLAQPRCDNVVARPKMRVVPTSVSDRRQFPTL